MGERRGRSLPPAAPRQRQVPGPSNGEPQRKRDTPLTPSRGSVDEVEDLLTAQLVQEGGAELLRYLLAKAVPPDESTPNVTPFREWTFRDIMRLPEAQQREWKAACREELEALCKRGVFELVDLPKGKKLIKN